MRAHGPITAIVAPPPTPNGDLHVGHLAGPYLAADVFRRYLSLRGRPCVSALSVDTHQSYVVTTAERLETSPERLARESLADIRATLAGAGFDFDTVDAPDSHYRRYVQDWFRRAYAAGLFVREIEKMPFDPKRGRFLFEAFLSGSCPTCLTSTKGNICEHCGHPNSPGTLFHPTVTGDADAQIESRDCTVFYFDLEAWRPALLAHLTEMAPLRPSLRRLLDELLAHRLPKAPITFPTDWGVPAPFPDAEGLALNVWAEMLPGHYHWIRRAAHAAHGSAAGDTWSDFRYVQFLGFDNSFFYAVLHLALALAARASGLPYLLPERICTNEFYQLGASKFSTSERNVIWGRDLLKTASADAVRFYLCRTNPETQQTAFSMEDFERVTAEEFLGPWSELEALLASDAASSALDPSCAEAAALLSRFEQAFEADGSLRLAADTLVVGVRAALAQTRKHRRTSLAAVLAIGAAPIAPHAASRLWRALGEPGEPAWFDRVSPTVARAPKQELSA